MSGARAVTAADALLVSLLANSYFLLRAEPVLIPLFAVLFLAANAAPLFSAPKLPGLRLKVCNHGASCLKIFLFSAAVSTVFQLCAAVRLLPLGEWRQWLFSVLLCVAAEAVVFWNGMICVYCASVQLGIRRRAIGIICGMIPVVHLVLLFKIIKTVSDEVKFEFEKHKLNAARAESRVCETKYPILLVHGVFFRDSKVLNYWGRIPAELEKNGAQIYYGNHQSAASVADSAAELCARIKEITEKTGCGRVNVIAHSKGGLDCRYAAANLGADKYMASLTTINTPHRGCEFADYLLGVIPKPAVDKIASAYNSALKKLGDENPDFIAAVNDLTAEGCARMEAPEPEGVLCQSVGSKLNRALGGKFPLNFTYHLVNYFDGPNDGLVSEKSFRWGESYRFLQVSGKRGISHADMVDLNRENIPGFDVREFYVELVSNLKKRGL